MSAVAAPGEARSRYAELVVDGTSGRILTARNVDARKYPASLTKIMTLYMVFEALDNGKLRLDGRLITSRRAAGQPNMKLGLRRGEAITVRQAILALVTKSANDVATVVAEAISGSEFKFALMMTRRARDLGMSRTTFRNASGLPNRRQLSTARDMARLALAIRRDFPDHFEFFAAKSFTFRGKTYYSHNNLVGNFRGVDGIKTGYIRASGFNLVTSASRDEGRLVAVLFGGRSAKSRDRRMRKLLAHGFTRLARGSQGLPGQYVRPRGRHDGFGHVPVPRYKPRNAFRGKSLHMALDAAKASDQYAIAWSVQIGAFSRVVRAQRHLAKLAGALSDLLSQAKVTIETIANDRAVTYRARLHGLNERQAHDLCRRIKSAQFDCLTIAPSEAALAVAKDHG
ncbi:MAG: D-alanyl-D-alanine carboxypeptidase family protein [Alphaproteobacteria bacterium]